MNKNDLVAAMANKTGLSKKDAELALTAAMDAITEALVSGDRVQLVGFGTFDTKFREARVGRNPSSGEALEIAAARIPQFKPGKALKDAVDL